MGSLSPAALPLRTLLTVPLFTVMSCGSVTDTTGPAWMPISYRCRRVTCGDRLPSQTEDVGSSMPPDHLRTEVGQKGILDAGDVGGRRQEGQFSEGTLVVGRAVGGGGRRAAARQLLAQ